jgi:hypothetical protein
MNREDLIEPKQKAQAKGGATLHPTTKTLFLIESSRMIWFDHQKDQQPDHQEDQQNYSKIIS